MSARAVRSIEEYLSQLRAALNGEDAALTQEALEASWEYLRSEVAASPGKSEGDVLELITSTYGAPEDMAAVYRTAGAESIHVNPVLEGQPIGARWEHRPCRSGRPSRVARRI